MNRNPLDLPLKAADSRCNARTPTGYCKNKAGFNTTHPGEGRCYLHGGLSPTTGQDNDALKEAIYSKFLPTTLAIELTEVKQDPTFTTLFEELALLKIVLQGFLFKLPADIAASWGRRVCPICGEKMKKQKGWKVLLPRNWRGEQERFKQLLSTIEAIGKTFERISKHEERQRRFVTISEIESIMTRWGQILMDVLGDDPRISIIQQKILNEGFTRRPGTQDTEKLKLIREFQRRVENQRHIVNNKRSLGDAIKRVIPEYFEDVEDVTEEEDEPDRKTTHTRVSKQKSHSRDGKARRRVKSKRKNGANSNDDALSSS